MTRLHLVRHGQVENPEKVVYGRQLGWHLSARGRKEAEAVARHLADRPLQRVYTSPLERAKETAEIVAAAWRCPAEARDDLLESQLCAPWEGLSWREVRWRDVRGWMRYLTRPHEIREVPETLRALAARMEDALAAIVAAHPGGEAVVVSHGDPIKAAVLVLTGGDLGQLHAEPVPTGGIVTVEIEGVTARVTERWSPRMEPPARPSDPPR